MSAFDDFDGIRVIGLSDEHIYLHFLAAAINSIYTNIYMISYSVRITSFDDRWLPIQRNVRIICK